MYQHWDIRIFCDNCEVGEPIRVSFWVILTRLSEVQARIAPIGWVAEAYPVRKAS